MEYANSKIPTATENWGSRVEERRQTCDIQGGLAQTLSSPELNLEVPIKTHDFFIFKNVSTFFLELSTEKAISAAVMTPTD